MNELVGDFAILLGLMLGFSAVVWACEIRLYMLGQILKD